MEWSWLLFAVWVGFCPYIVSRLAYVIYYRRTHRRASVSRITDAEYWSNRILAEVEATQKPRITPELRAELNQTPEWWDKKFHALLDETSGEFVEHGDYEYVEEMTLAGPAVVYEIPPTREYLGCTCSECKRARRK